MELELIKKVVGSGLAFNLTHIDIGTETTTKWFYLSY